MTKEIRMAKDRIATEIESRDCSGVVFALTSGDGPARFMVAMRAKRSIEAFHGPIGLLPRCGRRKSSGAFQSGPQQQKCLRTAAPQDAIARAGRRYGVFGLRHSFVIRHSRFVILHPVGQAMVFMITLKSI